MLELLTVLWFFNPSQPPQSVLTTQAPQAEFAAPAKAPDGFTVKFTVDLKKFDGEKNILEIPDVLAVRLRQHDPLDRKRQNYPAFKMHDGSVPVLEATLTLHSAEHPDWKEMTIGIPLAMLKRAAGEHEVVLNFSGVRWTMYVDGELADNDFPFGYPQWAATNVWKIDTEFVKKAAIFLPTVTPEKKPAKAFNTAPVQYWTPPGHNSWVGDVVTFFHQGRYHVFYLYDRRHHASKFGKGAHYFEHISTTDFKTWTEHEAATPLEEQWECIGTGTPFVFNNKFCLSYGLHTGRIYPNEKTTWPAQWDFLKANGRTGEFTREKTPGVPAGTTYSVSADGVSNFKKSWIMFHPCQNPSVYTDPGGKLRMLANAGSKGIWESDAIDNGWRCVRPDFPPGGDCTFFFRWGKFDYIIGGFKDFWSKPADAPDSAYEDVVRKGLDFYDGLSVPAITEISEGRFLMAGWLGVRGWGGNLVIRELIQYPDGRIGAKWMKELMPAAEKPQTLAAKIADAAAFPAESPSFLLTFDVVPAEAKKGQVRVSFLPEDNGRGQQDLHLDLAERSASFGRPIKNLLGVDKPFTVRVIVKSDDKLGGSLLDAEIAGQRTVIRFREDLAVKKIGFRAEGVEVKNVQIAPLATKTKARRASAQDVFDNRQPVIFQDNFQSGQFGKWRFSENDNYQIPLADPDRIKIVDAPGLEAGRRAVRFAVKRAPNSFRSEISLPHEPGYHERWYAERIYVPKDWVLDPSRAVDIVMQWHAIPGNWRATYPNLEISIGGGNWFIRQSYGSPQTKPTRTNQKLEDPVRPGSWVSWVIHAKWSPGDDGLLQIWKDGKLVLDRSGPNVYSTIGVEYTPYLKTGIYRPEWHLDKDAKREAFEKEKPVATNKVIYVTDVKIGNERAKYADVAPSP